MSPEKNKKTIYDVAEKAGVSRQTVSRVLNNRPDVSAVTRKRVQEIIEELNYHPNAIAQSLSRQRSRLFGVVTAGLKYIGPSRTLSGITNKAEQLGYGLLLKELANFSVNNVGSLLQWFQSHQVDGIIWAVPEIGDNHNWLGNLLPKVEIPIFFLSMEKRRQISIVSMDNYYGARLAVQHLLELGLNNIGHIAGPLDWWEARQRRAGWISALSEAGHKPTENMCAEGNWSSMSGKTAFAELMKHFPQMDSVFVGNDQMALGVLQTAIEQGKKIPNNLKVIGFDGIPESEFFNPPLSTIFQDQNKLGGTAVEELVKVVEANHISNVLIEPKQVMIQPELIIRRSTQGY